MLPFIVYHEFVDIKIQKNEVLEAEEAEPYQLTKLDV